MMNGNSKPNITSENNEIVLTPDEKQFFINFYSYFYSVEHFDQFYGLNNNKEKNENELVITLAQFKIDEIKVQLEKNTIYVIAERTINNEYELYKWVYMIPENKKLKDYRFNEQTGDLVFYFE